MRVMARKPATYQDLLALPEGLLGQILDGELVTSPRPAPGHSLATSTLGIELGAPFSRGRGGPGGWWILDEPELHLGHDVLVPDLAGWRRERMPYLPTEPFFTIAPTWVCEVLSPSTVSLDRIRKLPIYARESVDHAWLIDPVARTLEVFRREGNRWYLAGAFSGDERVHAEPFDAVELELGILRAPIPPAPAP